MLVLKCLPNLWFLFKICGSFTLAACQLVLKNHLEQTENQSLKHHFCSKNLFMESVTHSFRKSMNIFD